MDDLEIAITTKHNCYTVTIHVSIKLTFLIFEAMFDGRQVSHLWGARTEDSTQN